MEENKLPTIEEVHASDWYQERPEVVKQMIDLRPPTQWYRIKATGKKCCIYSYDEPVSGKVEDGTYTVITDGLLFGQHAVFGYTADDLEVWQEGDENKPPEPSEKELCGDCMVNVFDEEDGIRKNYYVVQNDIWDHYGNGTGMLCIACLEKRLGRKLIASDFTECIINMTNEYVMSL